MCFSLCLCIFSGLPGADAQIPKLSFSAALTAPMDRAGTIVFDKVFVNEGNFYNPRTGEHEQRLASAGCPLVTGLRVRTLIFSWHCVDVDN